jgi:hypothetical protein
VDRAVQALWDDTLGYREHDGFRSSTNNHVAEQILGGMVSPMRRESFGTELTAWSLPSRPAPPNVTRVPGSTVSVLVTVNCGVAVTASVGCSMLEVTSPLTLEAESCSGITATRDEGRSKTQDLLRGQDHVEWTGHSGSAYR